MMFKLQKVFDSATINSNNFIKDKQQFDDFISKLLERKLIIDQDKDLFNIHIQNFPFTFENISNYIKQIYRFEIESLIENKINAHELILDKINKFLSFYSLTSLSNEDIVQVLTSLITNTHHLSQAISNFKKSEFIIKNIRDDIQKFLWEKIYQTTENKSEEFFKKLDVTITEPEEYQHLYQEKIQFEYEIIKVRKIHYSSINTTGANKKVKKGIISEKAYCADRNIAIQCFKIASTYYDKEDLERFYFKCEAGKELLLSKYFQKFIGFDESSSEEYQYYFFENIEGGIKLIPFFSSIETEKLETSFFFKYIAKEILSSFRDLLNKCTYSFYFPITCDNFYYEKNQFRLFTQNISFGPKRKSIMESHQILEAKLLYFYGMILLNLLSLKYPGLKELIVFLNEHCSNLEEFSRMQKVFDFIFHIEESLTHNLENDVIISIIIECLLSPYKAKIVFDEFYEKKNFLHKAIKARHTKEAQSETASKLKEGLKESMPLETEMASTKRKCDISNLESETDRDKISILSPYYLDNQENQNEIVIKNALTINMLLIHPFYSNTNLDEQFLRYLFKGSESEEKTNF